MQSWTYTKGVHDLGNGNYAYLQPDRGSGWGWSNSGLVVDGDEALLVDTFRDEKLTKTMLDAYRDVTRREARDIGQLVNTHKDGDHWFGNRLMAHARIIASHATANAMRFAGPGVFREALRNRPQGLVGDYILRLFGPPFDFEGVDPVLPNELFSDRLELKVGDKIVQLIEVGPAHTEGDVIVHVPSSRTVYTGDILFLTNTPVIWAGPAENWIKACDLILSLDVEVVVPGHGPITDKSGVRQVRDYLTYVRDESRKRFDAGLSVEEAIRDISLGDYASWGAPERIVINVDHFYREFRGDKTPRYLFNYLEQLVPMAMKSSSAR
jgi:glyoxylase-like metal-dependent hydrolase (beta-lactamase superfamily II)